MSHASVMGTIMSLSLYIVKDVLVMENADKDLKNCQKFISIPQNR